MKLYKQIAIKFNALKKLEKIGDTEGESKHLVASIEKLTKKFMFINTRFSFYDSKSDTLVWLMNYKDDSHVIEEIKIIVTPNFQFDFNIKIQGFNDDQNNIKEYITEKIIRDLKTELDYDDFFKY